MPIIGKCCTSKTTDTSGLLTMNKVKLHYQALQTIMQDTQKSQYNSSFVVEKRCYIKDYSIKAIDEGYVQGIQNQTNTKELIFAYFNIAGMNFNTVEWAGGSYQVIGYGKISKITIEGKKLYATDEEPFISIRIGAKKV